VPTSITIGRMSRPVSTTSVLVAALLLGAPIATAAAPPSGDAKGSTPTAIAVYEKAKVAAGNRSVFLAFHASWCLWCRALERLTVLPTTKPVFDRYYEVAWLTVDETPSRKSLENPGADELRKRIGGDGVALPFYAVVDSKGSVVATSVRPGLDGKKENIGFPGTPDEVETFLALFRAGAPELTENEGRALANGIAALLKR
jgi:thiol:disulfide interchange protein